MADTGPPELDSAINVTHPVIVGVPSSPFFVIEQDGTCRFQGRVIGVDPVVHRAFVRNAFWLDGMEEEEIPLFGSAPAGYASICTVDGKIGLELVLPYSDEMPGEPYNRVIIGATGCFRGESERRLSDNEMWKVVQDWAYAGVN